MYPSELAEYIDSRNCCLSREETLFVIDVSRHLQLSHIQLNIGDGSYDMWDYEGNHYHFYVKN